MRSEMRTHFGVVLQRNSKVYVECTIIRPTRAHVKRQQNIITNTGIKKQRNKKYPYIVVFQPTGIQIWFGSLLKINKNEMNKHNNNGIRN